MDITDLFLRQVQKKQTKEKESKDFDGDEDEEERVFFNVHQMKRSPSLLLLHAHNLLRKLQEMELKVLRSFHAYMNYANADSMLMSAPREHAGQKLGFLASQRVALEQEVTVFAVSWTTEVNELKRNYAADINFKSGTHRSEFYNSIISYLLERLQDFSNFSLAMKAQRAKHHINPFKLHRNMNSITSWSLTKQKTLQTESSSSRSGFVSRMLTSTVINAKPVKEESHSPQSIPSDFASRFSSEVAAPKKLKEYEAFADKHKESLMAESKQLSEKFSENLQTAYQIEKSVVGVFDMLNQFIGLLKDQEDVIVDVHDTSKTATQHVRDTDEQLLMTIERSKTYQRSTVVLIFLMAIFLLLLDAMNP